MKVLKLDEISIIMVMLSLEDKSDILGKIFLPLYSFIKRYFSTPEYDREFPESFGRYLYNGLDLETLFCTLNTYDSPRDFVAEMFVKWCLERANSIGGVELYSTGYRRGNIFGGIKYHKTPQGNFIFTFDDCQGELSRFKEHGVEIDGFYHIDYDGLNVGVILETSVSKRVNVGGRSKTKELKKYLVRGLVDAVIFARFKFGDKFNFVSYLEDGVIDITIPYNKYLDMLSIELSELMPLKPPRYPQRHFRIIDHLNVYPSEYYRVCL